MLRQFLFWTLFLSTTTLLVMFIGCTTTSINQSPRMVQLLPPADAFLKPEIKATSTETPEQRFVALHEQVLNSTSTAPKNEKWLSHYRLAAFYAVRDSAKACEHFRALESDLEFPLRMVARVRAFGVCAVTTRAPSTQLIPLAPPQTIDDFLKSTSEPWLQAAAIDEAARFAEITQDKKKQLDLLLEQIDDAPMQSEKIRRLHTAIEIANTLGQVEAEKQLQVKLKLLAPRFTINPTASEWMKVAADFRQAREFEPARSYYLKILDPAYRFEETDKYKALQGIRMAYKIEKKTDEYVKATEDLAAFTEKKLKSKKTRSDWLSLYLESQLTLARTIWTERGSNQAEEVLANVEKNGRGQLPLNELRWLQSRIQEERGEFNEAFKTLEKIKIEHVSDQELKTRILWARAWNLRKAGRLPEAKSAMLSHLKQEPNKIMAFRARYWLAKIHLQLAEKTDAEKLLTELAEDDPIGFYGLLSHRELGRPLPAIGTRVDTTTSTLEGMVDSQEVLTLEWLVALNENDLGSRFLDFLAKKHQLAKLRDQELWRKLLRHYARVGNYRSLFARLSDLPASQRHEILQTEPELLFPKPFLDDVEAASLKFSVPHELIYAIMRQESSFHRFARSHADAFGLMQLIPEAATTAAGLASVPYAKPEDLYNPRVNIPLGSAFLKNLLDRYDQQIILTAASYNASEKAIEGWLKTRFRGDSLQFIEDIPYEETRNYVKLVVRNFIFYSRVLSTKTAIAFPEETLRLDPTRLDPKRLDQNRLDASAPIDAPAVKPTETPAAKPNDVSKPADPNQVAVKNEGN